MISRKLLQLFSQKFEYDDEGNVIPAEADIFESDSNGDLQPTVIGTRDDFFEIDIDNNITPQD